jgi:hypothetical protein
MPTESDIHCPYGQILKSSQRAMREGSLLRPQHDADRAMPQDTTTGVCANHMATRSLLPVFDFARE